MPKSPLARLSAGFALAALVAATQPASAVLVRTFTALAEVNAGPDANEVGGGTVDVWTRSPGGGNTGTYGSFLGDSGGNAGGSGSGAGASAWALYANSGSAVTATADVVALMGRSLSLTGDSISLDFDNGWIDNGRSVAIRFLTSDSGYTYTSQLSFTGGQSGYQLNDALGTLDTGIGFTGDGFNVTLTLTSDDGDYTIDVGGTTLASRLLAGPSQQIVGIAVLNDSAGEFSERNLYFNNLSITAVPEFVPVLSAPFLAAAWLIRRRKPAA